MNELYIKWVLELATQEYNGHITTLKLTALRLGLML